MSPVAPVEADRLGASAGLQLRRASQLPIILSVAVAAAYLATVLSSERQAAVLGLVVTAIAACWACSRLGILDLVRKSFLEHEALATALCVVAVLGVATLFHENSFVLFLLAAILVNMTACFGLTIQFGYAGLLNFAGGSMLGVGGYVAALLGGMEVVPPILLLPIGGIVAALIGSILLPPMLRTKGHYSAVITIAFSLLFTTFLESFRPFGGSQGVSVPTMSLFGWEFSESIKIGGFSYAFYMNYLLLALLLTVVVGIGVRRIERSWIGLSLDAVRIDETASSCFGIGITSVKVFAFTVGNFIIGMSGALYALMLGYIAPSNFSFGDSLILITVILLGGIGSIWGVVITTAIVQILPERLQAIQEYRLFLYAVVVLLVLRFVPKGLIPRPVRKYFPGRGG